MVQGKREIFNILLMENKMKPVTLSPKHSLYSENLIYRKRICFIKNDNLLSLYWYFKLLNNKIKQIKFKSA